MRYQKEVSIHRQSSFQDWVYILVTRDGTYGKVDLQVQPRSPIDHTKTGAKHAQPGFPLPVHTPGWKRRSPQHPNQFSSMQVNQPRTRQGAPWYPMIGERCPGPSLLGIRLMREGSGGVKCPERVSIPTLM